MKTFNEIRNMIGTYQSEAKMDLHPTIKKAAADPDAHGHEVIHNKDGHSIHRVDHDEQLDFYHHDHKTNKVHHTQYDHEDHGEQNDPDNHAEFKKDMKKDLKNSPSHIHSAIAKHIKKVAG